MSAFGKLGPHIEAAGPIFPKSLQPRGLVPTVLRCHPSSVDRRGPDAADIRRSKSRHDADKDADVRGEKADRMTTRSRQQKYRGQDEVRFGHHASLHIPLIPAPERGSRGPISVTCDRGSRSALCGDQRKRVAWCINLISSCAGHGSEIRRLGAVPPVAIRAR